MSFEKSVFIFIRNCRIKSGQWGEVLDFECFLWNEWRLKRLENEDFEWWSWWWGERRFDEKILWKTRKSLRNMNLGK
jgi:hypothetical protein